MLFILHTYDKFCRKSQPRKKRGHDIMTRFIVCNNNNDHNIVYFKVHLRSLASWLAPLLKVEQVISIHRTAMDSSMDQAMDQCQAILHHQVIVVLGQPLWTKKKLRSR